MISQSVSIRGLQFLAIFSTFLFSSSYATTFSMPAPGDDIVGEVMTVRARSGDTLLNIGTRYNIGMHEMIEANQQLGGDQGSAYRSLRRGTKVTVPNQFVLPPFRKGIVINLPELRLYYFSTDGRRVYTYPVGLGRVSWRTPLTSTTVIRKEAGPTWYPPKRIKNFVYEETGKVLHDAVPPGPENPLGPYALYLGTSGYLIHGTNQPWSIGKYISAGCIRLLNEDVSELWPMVPVGAPVHIINYSNKVGWSNGQLYLEAQIPLQMGKAEGGLTRNSLSTAINEATKTRHANIDWNKAERALVEEHGIPVLIGDADGAAPGGTYQQPKSHRAQKPSEPQHTVVIETYRNWVWQDTGAATSWDEEEDEDDSY